MGKDIISEREDGTEKRSGKGEEEGGDAGCN